MRTITEELEMLLEDIEDHLDDMEASILESPLMLVEFEIKRIKHNANVYLKESLENIIRKLREDKK